jgi:alanine dehydrogenase
MLTLGIMGRSRKENEHRLPVHPDHFDQIPERLTSAIRFEEGYGLPFGVPDTELSRRFAGVGTHEELMADSDVVLLPKPLPEDLREQREGGVLWGWPHCVQQEEITQVAIDRRLTLIAWEAMFGWSANGSRGTHVFERNNEMAGYAGVIHALGLVGLDGFYGPRTKAVVLSHGSVSRGAIHALLGRGFADLTVYTQRPPWGVHDKIPGCRYGRIYQDDSGALIAVSEEHEERPLIDVLAEAQVIVNGILQDTDNPLMFLREGEESRLKSGMLIADISCDLAMGFPFARPTSFEEPSFEVQGATYYAVDHSPSYLWRSATWELSRAVVPFLPTVMGGPETWNGDETIRRSIEIRDGVVQNPKILSFQKRSEEYPHPIAGS